MTTFNEQFKVMHGRAPTDRELQRMMKVTKGLGIEENDALVLLFFALENYTTLYGAIPDKITDAVKKITDDAQTIAETKLQVLVNDIVDKIADEASKSVNKIAVKKASSEQWKWIVIAAVTCSLSLLAVAGGSYWLGSKEKSVSYDAGYAAGQQSNLDAKAVASWANTTEGALAYDLYRSGTLLHAYQLHKAGSLEGLVKCSFPGWVKEGNICYPLKDPKLPQYGWYYR